MKHKETGIVTGNFVPVVAGDAKRERFSETIIF